MADFKDRFGIEYLRSVPTTKQSHPKDEQISSELETTLIAYSRPILEALKQSGGEALILELAEKTNVRIDTLIPVVTYLRTKGLVKTISEGRVGNDTIGLTDLALKTLS